jgi:hypothetical protein
MLAAAGGDVDAVVAQLGLPSNVAAAARVYAETAPGDRDLSKLVAGLFKEDGRIA